MVHVRGKIVQTQTGGKKDHRLNIIEASFGSQNQLTNKNHTAIPKQNIYLKTLFLIPSFKIEKNQIRTCVLKRGQHVVRAAACIHVGCHRSCSLRRLRRCHVPRCACAEVGKTI